jgi:GNAT superfamily N-acetyltransferase
MGVAASLVMWGSEVVRGLQERTARAFPARRVEDAEGWWLRHGAGCAWWTATALPHGDAGAGELARRVAGAEEFYARYGEVARIQISPGVCPDGLDAYLDGRGYRRRGLISLRVGVTARVRERAPVGVARVRLHERPAREWFEVWNAVHGHGGESRAEWDMLGRVERPSAYACALIGDDVVAVGRAVADAGWAGVFGMATLPGARGKGAGRDVLAALAHWAGAQAAGHMYLQVVSENVAALRLYEGMGFTEICGYHYRVAGL